MVVEISVVFESSWRATCFPNLAGFHPFLKLHDLKINIVSVCKISLKPDFHYELPAVEISWALTFSR